MKKSTIIIIITVLIFIIVIVLSAYRTYEEVVNVDYIYPGISIGGKSVYGLNKEQAIEKLKPDFRSEISNSKLIMKANEYVVEVEPDDVGFRWNLEDAVEKAYAIGRTGNPIARYKVIQEASKGVNIPVDFFYDKEMIEDIVKNTGLVINKEPEEGEFEFIDGKIVAHDGRPGYKVAEDFLREEITNYAKTIYSLNDTKTIDLELEEIKPFDKTEYSRVNGVIARFTTSLKGSSKDRIYNVRLSADAVSGKMLKPGESLSFNESTGPRTASNGYKNALVIIDGSYKDGTGGGVCQTSTTLYNALIKANISIDERHNHSIPASYIDYGLDAAVNDYNMDLKFTNNYDFPIFIYGEVDGQTITFTVYGDVNAINNSFEFKSVVLKREEPEVIEKLDLEMPINSKELVKQGYPGLHVISYRYEYDKAGKLVEKTILNRDYYRKINYEYKVGEKIEVPWTPNIPGEVENDSSKGRVEDSSFVDLELENNNGILDVEERDIND